MCAINPIHKKRMIFDFYTSEKVSKEEFENKIIEICLTTEQSMNQSGLIRCHVKETEQEAD